MDWVAKKGQKETSAFLQSLFRVFILLEASLKVYTKHRSIQTVLLMLMLQQGCRYHCSEIHQWCVTKRFKLLWNQSNIYVSNLSVFHRELFDTLLMTSAGNY